MVTTRPYNDAQQYASDSGRTLSLGSLVIISSPALPRIRFEVDAAIVIPRRRNCARASNHFMVGGECEVSGGLRSSIHSFEEDLRKQD